MLRPIALFSLVLIVVIGAALFWLTSTRSGLEWVLDAVVQASEGRLRVERAEGSLRQGFILQAVRIEDSGLRVDLGEVRAQIGLAVLWTRTVDIQALQVQHVLIVAGDEAAQPEDGSLSAKLRVPAWVLPQIELPVAFSLRQLETGPWRYGEIVLADRVSLQAEVSPSGAVRAESFEIVREGDRLDLTGVLPGPDGVRATWTAGDDPVARGQVSATPAELRVEVELPEEGEFSFVLDREARWTLHLSANTGLARRLDLAAPAGSSMRLDLSGRDQAIQLNGMFSAVDWPSVQVTGGLLLGDEDVVLDDVAITDDAGGRLTVAGAISSADEGRFDLEAEQVRLWPIGAQIDWLSGTGRLDIEGDTLHLGWNGQVSSPQAEPDFTVDAAWSGDVITLRSLVLQLPGPVSACAEADTECPAGRRPNLSLEGGLVLGEPLRLNAEVHSEGFDPGWLVAGLRGRVDGSARAEAEIQGEAWALALHDVDLRGGLNGRPLRATGTLQLDTGRAPRGDVRVKLGEGTARVEGRDEGVALTLDRFELGGLVEGLSGVADGTLRSSWPWSLPSTRGELGISRPAWQGWRADRIALRGGLDAGEGPLRLRLDGLVSDAMAGAASVEAEITGGAEALTGQLRLRHEQLTIDATFDGRLGAGSRSAEVSSLRVEHARLDAWTLREPLQWTSTDRGWTLGPACLVDGHASLCAQRDDAEAPVLVQLREVELDRLSGLLEPETGLRAHGVLTADVEIIEAESGWSLRHALLDLGAGDLLATEGEEPLTLLQWASIGATLAPEDAALRLQLDGALVDGGSARASLRIAALSRTGFEQAVGTVDLHLPQLEFLGVLTPDLVGAKGRLHAALARTGSDVEWQGHVQLADLTGSVPMLGLVLGESSLEARREEGRWVLEGLVDTGQGPLRLEGQWPDLGQPEGRIVGQSVQLSDTRTLRLLASPDLRLRYAEGRVAVTGTVQVPEARLDLERLEAGEPVSNDVVVLDPVAPAERPGPPVTADVELQLGESVSLRGFGFDGGIAGNLRIRERPGRSAEGRGTLEVRGQYRAYGQDLQIVRGRLLFAGGALDNPGIDLRAVRKVREVEVGIDVQGQARAPELHVWSNPVLDEAEAVSYLVLGQPLRSAQGGDDARLGQAAAALGGNLLAARLGSRLGVDTVGVSDSAALGGSAFTIGKYLSPSLYLSYGVGLFEPGQVVTLRYLLSERADVEVESARESRVGINYRWETE